MDGQKRCRQTGLNCGEITGPNYSETKFPASAKRPAPIRASTAAIVRSIQILAFKYIIRVFSTEKKIETSKKKLTALGDMRPGSLSKQYNVCGNPTCRCKDPDNPKKHGPYHQLSYTHKSRSKSEFVKKEDLAEVKKK